MISIIRYFHKSINTAANCCRLGDTLLSFRPTGSTLPGVSAVGKILICIMLLMINQLSASASSSLTGKLPSLAGLHVVSRGPNWILVQSEVLGDGGSGITERGIAYITSGSDTEQRISAEAGSGTFSIKLPDLAVNKTYFIKSYAINTEGISYGPGMEVRTLRAPVFASGITPVTVYGKSYRSVVKVQADGGLETKVTATKKPRWMELSSEPEVHTLAGNGTMGASNGPGLLATFRAPYALASDASGNIYVAEQAGHSIRKISSGGEVVLLAGGNEAGYQNGNGSSARFDSPSGIAVDAFGNVYVSDQNNNCIRKISPSGDVTTLAGSRSAGHADGKGVEAQFKFPAGLAVDNKGYLFVADRGNNTIRVISPQGEVSTLAGSRKAGFAEGKGTSAMFNAPTGIAISASGDTYVTDQVNNRIRKITSSGQVSTLAGSGLFTSADGKGLLAGFSYPTGLTIDAAGSLFVTDQLSHSIRRISEGGSVSTVVGGGQGFSEGTGSAAKFRNPSGICLNSSGDIFVADLHNFRIRKIITDVVLSGTPSRSDVGTSEVVLKATNEAGTTSQTLSLMVRDDLSPQMTSFSPASGADLIPRSPVLTLTFDEEVFLADSGLITLSKDAQIIKSFDLKLSNDRAKLLLSPNRKSLRIDDIADLPPNTLIKVHITQGVVRDSSQNVFKGLPANSWNFTTKSPEAQSVNFQPSWEKTYGDSSFLLGPSLSPAGLPVIYTVEDTTILAIKGNSAIILKAGRTKLNAVQGGNNLYAAVKTSSELTVHPRSIRIQPVAGQHKGYGEPDPEIKFSIISDSLANGDRFAGKLNRVSGDTAGVYAIMTGTLTLNSNYTLSILNDVLTIKKAPLRIVADNKTKIAGQPNPEFTSSYIGFKNGDSIERLLKKPQMTSPSLTGSLPGEYKIEIGGAEAKNYEISYEEGSLKVISQEMPDFYLAAHTLMENRPAGSLAAVLISDQDMNASFSLISGAGDSDNDLFKIEGKLILTRAPLDYEDKKRYSIRVRSAGVYDGVKEKVLTIAVVDINEKPQIEPLADRPICFSGTILLRGINSGHGENQGVKVRIKSPDVKAFKTLKVSEVVNGEATITYSITDISATAVKMEILIKDDGGVEHGGIDSAVYNHTFRVLAPPVVSITSDKGLNLTKGEQALLTVNGSGTYRWSDSRGIINGHTSAFLRVSPGETTVYKVEVFNEAGCATEKEITLVVRESSQVVCYNVVTPNDDGKNDFFIVKNIDLFPENELKIYDRTGKIIYNRKQYSNDWNGTYKGMVLPAETYYYSLDLGPGKDKLKGFLLIIN